MIFSKQRAGLLFTLALLSTTVFAQVSTPDLQGVNADGVTEQDAQAALAQAGVSEEAIKQRLLQKGIDLDNLSPDQLATVDAEIQQAIKELQAEQSSIATTEGDGQDKPVETTTEPKVAPQPVQQEKLIESPEEILAKEMSERLTATRDLFGFNIFFNQSIGFYDKSNPSSVPNSYVLDAGDKIAINIFGQSQADLIYEIEEDGFIRPSGMYKVYLKGVSLGQAKTMLRRRFAQIYRFQDDQFNLSLNTARTIKVNIFGEVHNPGSYSISAMNNVINAIIGAGGPQRTANLRQIRVVSNGKERIVDIYDYITNPVASTSLKIYDGDLVFIEKSQKRVSANGKGFNGPTIFYELQDDEKLNDLIRYAGGVKNNVVLDRVQIETLEGEQRVLRDYPYEQAITSNYSLKNGDAVAITSHYLKTENYYVVRGTVRKPGRYELLEGDKVSTVIDKVIIEEETFSEVAYLTRHKKDGTFQLIKLDIPAVLNKNMDADIAIEPLDEIIFYNRRVFTDTFEISISGAVRDPGTYSVSRDETFTIYDLLIMSKGLEEFATDFGYIASVDYENRNKTDYTIVNVRKALEDPQSAENITLKPGDKLTIPSSMDYSDNFEIRISGAVRKPGTFNYNSDLSLKEIVVMAGGFKLEAATNRIDIYRLQINENEPTVTLSQSVTVDRDFKPLNLGADVTLEPFDHIVVRSAPEFEKIQYVKITGEVRYPGEYALISNNERITDIIARADGLTDEAFPEAGYVERSANGVSGKVVTRIDRAVNGRSKHDLVVKPGDVIVIPKTIDVVSIDRIGTNTITDFELQTGMIDSTDDQLNVQINYKPRRAKWYINKYGGGFSKDAKRSSTKVVYPNGQVRKTRNYGIVKIYPKVRRGSEIVLDLKEDKKSDEYKASRVAERRERLDRIIDSATAVLTLSTTAFSTIILSQKL